MIRIFAVNASNDIFATDGRIALNEDLQAVLQQCEHAMKTRRGELIYAAQLGPDYINAVFSGAPNVLRFEATARPILNRIDGVVRIESFDTSFSNNILSYTIRIRTRFGTGVVSGGI